MSQLKETMVRALAKGIATGMAGLAGLVVLAVAPAVAMGTGNQYEDLQVGVTYTVYQPGYTAGLTLKTYNLGLARTCLEGDEQNVLAQYGSFDATSLVIMEGNPLCLHPEGDGKIVSRTTIAGQAAEIMVYCIYEQPEWRNCSLADIAKRGGEISLTLPGAGGLRGTDVVVSTLSKKPLTYRQLVRVVRNLAQVGGRVTAGVGRQSGGLPPVARRTLSRTGLPPAPAPPANAPVADWRGSRAGSRASGPLAGLVVGGCPECGCPVDVPRVPRSRDGDIVSGKRTVTADTDLRLCRFFGPSDRYWLRAQAAHDIEVAQTQMADELRRIKPWTGTAA